MKKAEIKQTIATCLSQKRLCRIFFNYDEKYTYYIPLIIGDRLFLGIEEDDFILDGYSIRRFKDVTKAQIKNDMCQKILNHEGLINNIVTPEVDLSNWLMVFKSLQKRSNNIIVQNESLDKNECEFVIGRIEKVYGRFVYVRHFDADGEWQTEPYKMHYSRITSVTFASRYVDIFSKYLDKLPDNFGE